MDEQEFNRLKALSRVDRIVERIRNIESQIDDAIAGGRRDSLSVDLISIELGMIADDTCLLGSLSFDDDWYDG